MSIAWKRPRQVALILLAAMAATIGGALVFEHGFGLTPCKLCLQQRIPYYLAMPVAAAVVAVVGGMPRAAALALATVALLMAAGSAMGVYHAGAEWGFWPGPNDCGATGGPSAGQVGDFLSQLQTTRVVSCTEAAWRFLGLSLAGWNALIAACLSALAAGGAVLAWRQA